MPTRYTRDMSIAGDLTCEWCAVAFERPARRGPAPKFCGDAHRQAAHRARRRSDAPTPGPAVWANRRAIIELAESHGASNVRVFGSVARGHDTGASDVDLLVDLDPHVGLIAMIALEQAIEELLGHRVDLVPAAGLKSGIAASALAEAVVL